MPCSARPARRGELDGEGEPAAAVLAAGAGEHVEGASVLRVRGQERDRRNAAVDDRAVAAFAREERAVPARTRATRRRGWRRSARATACRASPPRRSGAARRGSSSRRRHELDIRGRRRRHRARVERRLRLGSFLAPAAPVANATPRRDSSNIEAALFTPSFEQVCAQAVVELAADAAPPRGPGRLAGSGTRSRQPPPKKITPAAPAPDDPPVDLCDGAKEPRAFGHRAIAVQPFRCVGDDRRVRRQEQLDDLVRIGLGIDVSDLHTRHVLAAILTIGNELVSGDTENTNASWLARRLESLGVRVAISAAVPDETDADRRVRPA